MSVDHDPIRASDAAIQRLRALHPSLIDLTTGRVERLLTALDRPQDRLGRVIHVAGTNGKGSICAFLRAMGEAAGLRVNVLTSPHLVRFAERIRIHGRLISDAELALRIDEVEAANAGAPISFFEIATALALHAFAEAGGDLAIIEVGLGGRFDATNVFAAPSVSVISPVDYDHTELLGAELGKIAWEKAGILKRRRPGVIGRQQPEALAVIEAEAKALEAPLRRLGIEFDGFLEHGRLRVQVEDRLLDLPAPALAGAHQAENAAVAAVAALGLADPRLDEGAIARGVAVARWPGRFQRLTRGAFAARVSRAGGDLWIDGAHNPHAARALAASCADLAARDGRPVSLIVGMLARKDAAGFFAAFADLKPGMAVVGFASPNAADPKDLAAAARAAGLATTIAGSAQAALDALLAPGGDPGHLVLCGSLHFIGDILAADPASWPD